MTHRQIETMREIRLWIGQIVVPVCTVVATALTIPEVRQAVGQKVTDMKTRYSEQKEKVKIKKKD